MPDQTLPAGCVQMFSVDTRPGQVCPLPGIGCDQGRGVCSPFDAMCAAGIPGEGETCDDGNECGPDGSCVNAGAGGAFVCVPMPGLGEACFLECVEEATCRFTADFGTCVPPICAEIPF